MSYKIIDSEFHTDDYGNAKYLRNWPMLYILENGKEAYVGESTNIIARMSQHKANSAKERFESAHFIYSSDFNQSVTFDYESKLIMMFAADEKYILTNNNGGLADKDYFQKEVYDKKFTDLWNRLLKKKLATHTIDEIINSDLFKYSPYKELNDDQREAVYNILHMLLEDPKQGIVVSGMPGSGKTIVAVYLMKFLKDYVDEETNTQPFANKKIGLVIPPTSLRKTLKNLFRHIYGLKAADIIGPSDVVKQHYDILLVDEAHRLHKRKNITSYQAHDNNNRKLGLPKDATELDWVLKQSDCAILFYDQNQLVGPWGIDHDTMENKTNDAFHNRMAHYYLSTQMRCKGGNDYIDYIKNILNGTQKEKETFEGYDFVLYDDFKAFEDKMYQLEKEKTLTRMIAGFAWPWISRKDKTKKDITIQNISRMWNCKTEDWVSCETAIDEVGCIHSIQGYDLNYAFVIIGPDLRYDPETKQIKADGSHYFDPKGKATATPEELTEYIRNIYYVLLTRGILGTYVYVCDDNLRKYLSAFINKA